MTRWLAAARKSGARRKIALAGAVITVLTAVGIPAGASAATTAAATRSAAGTVTVSGTITDGSGHGWPLYALVYLSDPAGNYYQAHTDPATGQYSVAVPANTAYSVTVIATYPGYLDSYATLQAGTTDLTENAQMTVNQFTCSAPGYQLSGGTCAKVTGGLIFGQVTDANTGQGIDGATVTDGQLTATTVATPGDTKLNGGLYWLFSPTSGPQTLTARMTNYLPATASATVTPDTAVRADMALAAGRLAITSAPIDATVPLGHTTQATITVTNSGGAAATAAVAVQHPGPLVDPSAVARHALPAAAGPRRGIRHPAGVVRIPGHYSPRANLTRLTPLRWRAVRHATGGWIRLGGGPIADGITDNGLVRDDSGHIYSVGGVDGVYSGVSYTRTADGWVYDPAKNAWTPIAPLPAPVQAPMAAYAGGKVYAIGGWINNNAAASATVRSYDPATNTWSAGPGTDMPAGRAAAGVAVLNDQIYVVGGCTDYQCDMASSAAVYDPGADAWQAIAPYPVAVADLACGGIGGAVYCFGGVSSGNTGMAAGYVYRPATNKWSPVAPLPADLWGASYAVANGQLLVSGGVSGGAITNAGYAYDPGSNTWSSLPPYELGGEPTYRGSGACGFYRLGGTSPYAIPAADFAVLSGWDQCGTPSVPWLKAPHAQITVPAHSSVHVTLTLDASALTQPGAVAAQVTLDPSGTPSAVAPSPVTLHVTPPAGWSQVTGTVTAQPCIGGAVPADHATVEITSGRTGVPVRTDASGHYGYWGNWRDSPSLLFAKNGYLVQQHTARVRPGGTTTVNATLRPDKRCS